MTEFQLDSQHLKMGCKKIADAVYPPTGLCLSTAEMRGYDLCRNY